MPDNQPPLIQIQEAEPDDHSRLKERALSNHYKRQGPLTTDQRQDLNSIKAPKTVDDLIVALNYPSSPQSRYIEDLVREQLDNANSVSDEKLNDENSLFDDQLANAIICEKFIIKFLDESYQLRKEEESNLLREFLRERIALERAKNPYVPQKMVQYDPNSIPNNLDALKRQIEDRMQKIEKYKNIISNCDNKLAELNEAAGKMKEQWNKDLIVKRDAYTRALIANDIVFTDSEGNKFSADSERGQSVIGDVFDGPSPLEMTNKLYDSFDMAEEQNKADEKTATKAQNPSEEAQTKDQNKSDHTNVPTPPPRPSPSGGKRPSAEHMTKMNEIKSAFKACKKLTNPNIAIPMSHQVMTVIASNDPNLQYLRGYEKYQHKKSIEKAKQAYNESMKQTGIDAEHTTNKAPEQVKGKAGEIIKHFAKKGMEGEEAMGSDLLKAIKDSKQQKVSVLTISVATKGDFDAAIDLRNKVDAVKEEKSETEKKLNQEEQSLDMEKRALNGEDLSNVKTSSNESSQETPKGPNSAQTF